MGNKYHYTIYDFFSFVNEKKELYKNTGRNKIQRNKISFSFANSFLSSGDLCFWSMCEISERVACHS